MVFSSLTFLAFFLLVLALYYLVPMSWNARKLVVLGASYVFYAAWNPPFVLLLMGSTVVDWIVAKRMAATTHRGARRALLLVSLVFNLGVLAFFKYGGFVLDNFVHLAAAFGVHYQPAAWNIVLPIGISFYTFLTLSYTIDVYYGSMKPGNSFLDYAFFITFFPHLVAGPIIRASGFLPQCITPRRASANQFGWGLTLMVLGLFEKVVLADAILAPSADRVYTRAAGAGFLDAWIGTLAFSGQIFFDFAGYTTCAIGCALCLGFVLTDNFRFPYAAIGFSDFWRRWHISLSTWLRDYLYIPLGGNRKGPARTTANLMVTMLLGGLWHGAAWRFVVWGGLHGTYLVAEQRARTWWGAWRIWDAWLMRVALALGTYALVCVTWVFFRAPALPAALRITGAMLAGGADRHLLERRDRITVLGLTILLLAAHWALRDTSLEDAWRRLPRWTRPVFLAAMLLTMLLVTGDERAFIYFQF